MKAEEYLEKVGGLLFCANAPRETPSVRKFTSHNSDCHQDSALKVLQ